MSKKCLWHHENEGTCITKKDIDNALMVEIVFGGHDNLTSKWLDHPKFREAVIEMGKSERLYPSTIIESTIQGSDAEDMRSDLKRWGE